MLAVGVTGSIGMGKSTTAALFAELGFPVFDADAAVRALYAGRAAPLVEAAFPGTTRAGAIDRNALAERVLGDRTALQRLEAIVHPLVREAEAAFLRRAEEGGAALAVLDIPLLLEGGRAPLMDAVVVASAPADVQRARVLARPAMTADRLERILARQWPDARKRAHADFVVDTGRGMEHARAEVLQIVGTLTDPARPFHARNRARHRDDRPRPL